MLLLLNDGDGDANGYKTTVFTSSSRQGRSRGRMYVYAKEVKPN